MTRGLVRKGTFPDQGYPRLKFMPLSKLATKDLAEQKLFETRRKGMHTPTAYTQYAEVDTRPTTKKVKGHQTVAFYGCGIYARENRDLCPRLAEQKRMQS